MKQSMKRTAQIIVISLMAAAGLLLASCTGQNGRAYEKFYWTTDLLYISDTNHATPATVYIDSFFPTNSGTYRVEYETVDQDAWYLEYDIYINQGGPGLVSGADNWYEIDLLPSGPAIYFLGNSARNPLAKSLTPVTNEGGSLMQKHGPILGTKRLDSSQGSIEIRYGRIIK